METTKICTCCNTEKNLTEFYKRSDTNKYRSHCKDCLSNKFNEQKEEIYSKRKKKYEANKELLNEKRRNHRLENIEHYRKLEKQRSLNEDRKKYKREHSVKYRQTENGKLSQLNKYHKRRAIIKSGNVATKQLKELYSTVKNCYWCNAKLTKDNTHLDHFMPLSKGGLHIIDNLVLSCNCCNLQKHAKDPYKFAIEKGRLL